MIQKIKSYFNNNPLILLGVTILLLLGFGMLKEHFKQKEVVSKVGFDISSYRKAQKTFRKDSVEIFKEVNEIKSKIDSLDEKLDSIGNANPDSYYRLQSRIDSLFNY